MLLSESGDLSAARSLDRERSLEVAQRTRAQFRRCWRNAALATQYLGRQARYVEGWIVVERSSPLVVEHGWCQVDNVIIDPTYTPYVCSLDEPVAYFGGLYLNGAEALAALQRHMLPLAWAKTLASYRAAFEAALRFTRNARGAAPYPREGLPTRVVHCRREAFDVFIGRTTMWGNPFRIGIDGTREHVVNRFREWIMRRPALLRATEELRGKTLGCFCAPQLCHGHVLAELADL